MANPYSSYTFRHFHETNKASLLNKLLDCKNNHLNIQFNFVNANILCITFLSLHTIHQHIISTIKSIPQSLALCVAVVVWQERNIREWKLGVHFMERKKCLNTHAFGKTVIIEILRRRHKWNGTHADNKPMIIITQSHKSCCTVVFHPYESVGAWRITITVAR